jgi:hypothetical protein
MLLICCGLEKEELIRCRVYNGDVAMLMMFDAMMFSRPREFPTSVFAILNATTTQICRALSSSNA